MKGDANMENEKHQTIKRDTYITTAQLAASLGVKAATIRHSHCLHDHYLGMKPKKLSNGRLMWSVAKRDHVLYGE